MSLPAFPLRPPEFSGASRLVSLRNSLSWIHYAWYLFIAQAGAWIAMTLLFFALLLGVFSVPWVGGILAAGLFPLLSVGFLDASREVASDKPLWILGLFSGIYRGHSALYGLSALSMLFALLCGLLYRLWMPPVGFSALVSTYYWARSSVVILLIAALSIVVHMAFCFAPALIVFNRMPLMAALQASFSACFKNIMPWGLYVALLCVLGIISALPLFFGMVILIPVMFGSLYAAYRDIFMAD